MGDIKIIRDTIHGYIDIEKDIVENIIDTPLFQRLRRIEQTSMRCLYPSARHDRFVHSIGTFYLSKRISHSLTEKFILLRKDGFDFDEKIFDKLNINLQMAALLHDIGHSPFSHTLENYFKLEKVDGDAKINIQLKDSLKSCVDDCVWQTFVKDFSLAGPSPHEVLSAVISVSNFKEPLKVICDNRGTEVDYDFIARAITGTKYTDKNKALENCFIQLLNSQAIDVDKLDYITRDSVISGYDNVKIDTERLIISITPYYFNDKNGQKQLILVYNKNAISVIQNVITCRNALYTWIYSHHKVQYETFLINKAINHIAKHISPDSPNDFICKFFSLENITENLLCDDDVWCLFKKHRDIADIDELFDRGNQKKAIWKSFVEFKELFPEKDSMLKLGDFSTENFKSIAGSDGEEAEEFKNYISHFETTELKPQLIKASIKLSSIAKQSILILLNGSIYSYDSLLEELNPSLSIDNFVYLYIEKEAKERLDLNSFIQYIKAYPKFKMTL